MRKKKRWGRRLVIVGVVLGIGVGSGLYAVKPVAETYVKPLVQDKLNTMINGTITYDSLSIGWDGQVHMTGVTVRDTHKAVIATAPEISVAINYGKALLLPVSKETPVALIGTIRLDQPSVHLEEEANGTWNIANLIKKTNSSDSKDFTSDIQIADGTVRLRIAKGQLFTVKAINGYASFANNPQLQVGATAQFNGQQLSLSGSYDMTETADFSLHVITPKLDANYVNTFMPAKLGAKVQGGAFTNIAITINRQQGNYHLSGHLSAKDIGFAYKGYQVSHIGGTLLFNNQEARLVGGQAVAFDAPIFLNGTVGLGNLKNPTVNLYANVKGLSLGKLQSLIQLPLTGTLGASLHVSGSLDNLQAMGQVTGRQLTYDKTTIDYMQADIAYKDKKVSIDNVNARLGQGWMNGSGYYSLGDKTFGATLYLDALPMNLLSPYIGSALEGSLSGLARIKGQGTTIQSLAADVAGQHVSYKGIQVPSLAIQVRSDGQIYHIPYVNLELDKGRLTAYGQVNARTKALQLEVDGHDIGLGLINQIYPLPETVGGSASLNASISGTLDNPTLEGQLTANDISYGTMHFTSAYGQFGLKNQLATIKRFILQDKAGVYQLAGTIQLDGQQALNLRASVGQARIENLIKPFTDLPITGWMTSTNQIRGTLSNPMVRGQFHAWDGSIYGKLYSDIKADYTYVNHNLYVPIFSGTSYGATIMGAGNIQNGQLNFNFLGNDIDLGPILSNVPGHIQGYAAVQGQLRGSLANPKFSGQMASQSIIMNGSQLTNLQGSVSADKHSLELGNFSFDQGKDGHYVVKGAMGLDNPKRISGQAQVTNGDVGDLLKLVNAPIKNTTGKLNGTILIDGQVSKPTTTIKGSIVDLTVGKNVLGTARVDAVIDNHTAHIYKFDVPVGTGLLAAGGTMDFDGTSNIQIAGRDVPVQLLMPAFTDNPVPLTGNLNFVTNISGQTRNPKVEMSVDMQQMAYNGVTIDHAYALMDMSNKVIHITQIMAQKGPYKLTAYGKIPLAAFYTSGYLPPGNDKGMDLTLDFNQANLGILPMLTSMVTAADGPMSGKIQVTGTYDQPQANGAVTISNGSISIKSVKDPLLLNGQLVAKGQQAEFTASGTMGKNKKGSLGISAVASWSGKSLSTYRAALQMDQLNIRSDYFIGPLNANLYVAPMNGLMTLAGNVDLANDTMSIPMSFSSSDSTMNLGMDLTVSAGNRVRMYSNNLYNVGFTGSAHFGGTMAHPYITGGFSVPRGSIQYLDTNFAISEGKANFTPGTFLPYIVVKANGRAQQYRVFLNVTGPVDQMNLKLTSDPPLTEEQIISLLTFGRTGVFSTGLHTGDANSLLVAGLQSLALGSVEGMVKNTLGLDVLNITTGDLNALADRGNNVDRNEYYNIEIAKYLLPNLMVSYSQGLNNNNAQYGVQYDLGQHFSLNAWKNRDRGAFAGAQWNYQF